MQTIYADTCKLGDECPFSEARAGGSCPGCEIDVSHHDNVIDLAVDAADRWELFRDENAAFDLLSSWKALGRLEKGLACVDNIKRSLDRSAC